MAGPAAGEGKARLPSILFMVAAALRGPGHSDWLHREETLAPAFLSARSPQQPASHRPSRTIPAILHSGKL